MKKIICMVLVAVLLCGCSTGTLQTKLLPQAEKTAAAEAETTMEPVQTEAQTEAQTEPTEPTEPEHYTYDDVLEQLYQYITGDDSIDIPGCTGAGEIVRNFSGAPADAVGYAVADVTGDGVEELIIGSIDSWAKKANMIAAIYTMQEEDAVVLEEGWARSLILMRSDGSFFYDGSDGSANSAFGVFSLEGGEKTWSKFYFSVMDDTRNIRYYYNKSGDWFINSPGTKEVTADKFREADTKYLKKAVYVPLIPFSMLKSEVYQLGMDARLAEDSDEVEWVQIPGADPQAKLILTAQTQVSEVRLLKLSIADSGEGIIYRVQELSPLELAQAGDAVGIQLTFYGDSPEYGITWNAAGVPRYATLTLSGMDGSAELMEISPESVVEIGPEETLEEISEEVTEDAANLE